MNYMKERKIKSCFVEGPIAPSFIAESLGHHTHKTEIGAHSMFLGQVRADMKEGQVVSGIDYSVYEAMANEQLHVIREAAFEQFSLTCLHIYHSKGWVPVGGISLFVFTSSAHRSAAMEACTYLVERIKKEVPVWGKECFESGGHVWKENTPST